MLRCVHCTGGSHLVKQQNATYTVSDTMNSGAHPQSRKRTSSANKGGK